MRPFSRRSVASGLAVVLLAAGCAAGGKAGADPVLEPLEVVSSSGVHKFQVEIADTEEERARGLMNRESLGRDRGMLFQFPDMAERSFWMKNTYIPLDIIYIAADGRIVSIAAQTTPFSESPVPSYGAARGVLEINGGMAQELGIKPGDRVRHPFFGAR